MGDGGGLGSRVVPEQGGDQLGALPRRAPQHRVDEAGGVSGAGRLDQLDRLVDRGVVGGRVGEEQLVEAEAQRRQHGRVEQSGRAAREPLDRRVGGAAPLHRPVGEALGLGPLAPGQAVAVGGGAEGPLGEGAVLEGGADHLEGERPGGGDGTHSFGNGWPRR